MKPVMNLILGFVSIVYLVYILSISAVSVFSDESKDETKSVTNFSKKSKFHIIL